MTIRVLLVDDHTIVRQGIAALLDKEMDIQIVGQAQTGLEALKMIPRLQPDILVLDIILPDLNGFEIAKKVQQEYSQTRVIFLSMHEDVAYAAEAQRKGAKAYVIKGSGVEHLVEAIRRVMHNKTYISPPLNQEMVNDYRRRTHTGQLNPIDTLTPSERLVFNLIVSGHTSREIADELKNSIRTVETHRANILRKFKVSNTLELIQFAINHNLPRPGKRPINQ